MNWHIYTPRKPICFFFFFLFLFFLFFSLILNSLFYLLGMNWNLDSILIGFLKLSSCVGGHV